MEEVIAVLDERNAEGDDEPELRPPGKNAAILDVTLYLESTLALLVRSFGGHVEEDVMSNVDIEYERRDGSGTVVRRCTPAG